MYQIEQTKPKKTQRDPALDIIRICAFLFVVSVHFFLNCGYYDTVFSGSGMFLATFVRQFLMICVPLFMMLTGYLTMNSTPCRAYYRKLVDTLGVYVLASVCCIVYDSIISQEPIQLYLLYQMVNSITSYYAAPYGWYVEMYIGLFLLSPFLNVGYRALNGKKQKQWLLVVMMILTALPNVLNVYFPRLSWFLDPQSSANYLKILPDYWKCLYPFFYYFLGSYIREYGVPLSSTKALVYSVLLALLQGAYNIWRCWGGVFIWGSWQDHSSLFVVIQSVLFFAMVLNRNLTHLPDKLCRLLCQLSGFCFGAYLVSYIFDDYFYTRLNAAIEYVPYRFPWFFVAVPLISACSLLLSFLINLCYANLKKIALRIWEVIQRNKSFSM